MQNNFMERASDSLRASGLFITFEGVEGSGKTTQIRRVAEWLRKERHRCILTREPGGTPLANRIRRILLDPKNKGIHPFLELTLYLAARRDHLERVIRPALRQGMVVLCDRFHDATLAYQGFGRRLPLKAVVRMNDSVIGPTRPDLTFLFDLPTAEGLRRAKGRHRKVDRLEKEAIRFHRRVRLGYLTLARRDRKRFRILDGRKSRAEIFREIRCRVEGFL